MGDRTVVAAFDVDGTLTTRDCVVAFLSTIAPKSSLVKEFLRRFVPLVQAVAHRDRDRLKAIATSAALSGRPWDDVARLGGEFGETAAANWLRDDTGSRLAWHLSEGHRVVLVSASYAAYLDAFGRRLGVHDVLATRIEVGPDGRCTGELDGPNCRGHEKWVRLSAWLADQGIERECAVIWAYGDSSGDRVMLANADHPVWVNHRKSSINAEP